MRRWFKIEGFAPRYFLSVVREEYGGILREMRTSAVRRLSFTGPTRALHRMAYRAAAVAHALAVQITATSPYRDHRLPYRDEGAGSRPRGRASGLRYISRSYSYPCVIFAQNPSGQYSKGRALASLWCSFSVWRLLPLCGKTLSCPSAHPLYDLHAVSASCRHKGNKEDHNS